MFLDITQHAERTLGMRPRSKGSQEKLEVAWTTKVSRGRGLLLKYFPTCHPFTRPLLSQITEAPGPLQCCSTSCDSTFFERTEGHLCSYSHSCECAQWAKAAALCRMCNGDAGMAEEEPSAAKSSTDGHPRSARYAAFVSCNIKRLTSRHT